QVVRLRILGRPEQPRAGGVNETIPPPVIALRESAADRAASQNVEPVSTPAAGRALPRKTPVPGSNLGVDAQRACPPIGRGTVARAGGSPPSYCAFSILFPGCRPAFFPRHDKGPALCENVSVMPQRPGPGGGQHSIFPRPSAKPRLLWTPEAMQPRRVLLS